MRIVGHRAVTRTCFRTAAPTASLTSQYWYDSAISRQYARPIRTVVRSTRCDKSLVVTCTTEQGEQWPLTSYLKVLMLVFLMMVVVRREVGVHISRAQRGHVGLLTIAGSPTHTVQREGRLQNAG